MESTQRPLSFSSPFCAVALPVLFLLISMPGARGQSAPARPAPSTAGTASAAARPNQAPASQQHEEGGAVPNDASHQGIKMHGHWAIDIKNPDGTLAHHHEFENSLTDGGYLIALMAGYAVPGDYAIFLNAPYGGTPPCTTSAAGGCAIVRSLTTAPAAGLCVNFYCVTGLTYAYNFGTNGGGPYSMVLVGSVTAQQAGSIGYVNTFHGGCPGNADRTTAVTTVSPATCATTADATSFSGLSSATPNTISVASGQIIQVTVTISFS